MGWLAGSPTAVAWMLLALETTLVLTSPVVDPDARSLQALRAAEVDDSDLRGEVAANLPSAAFDAQKRRWGRNNVAAWGKRSDASWDLDGPEVDKRRWGQKNMALWGKRFYDVDDNDTEPGDGYYPLTKRRWGQKHMAIWGKRADADQLEALKRKWGQKNMALWG